MNFSLIYFLPCWQESLENEIEIKARNSRKIEATEIGCAKELLKLIFLFFSLEAIYLSPESLERIIC